MKGLSERRGKPKDIDIAIVGGSGMSSWPRASEEMWIDTPYGVPSAPISFLEVGGRRVAFLARHGLAHEYPPHKINYQANIWALASIGVKTIFATGAVGCLRPDWDVGDIVICDQFVNRTWGRHDTFYDGPITTHISVSDPYCPNARAALTEASKRLTLTVRSSGILVVIQGPRFSTRAENRDLRRSGYDLISMTHYPEVVLSRELNVCYVSVCLITDYASVLDEPRMEAPGSSHAEVLAELSRNRESLTNLLTEAISGFRSSPTCICKRSLEGAQG